MHPMPVSSQHTVRASAPGWLTHTTILLGLKVSTLMSDSVRMGGAMVFETAFDHLVQKGDELLRAMLALMIVGFTLQLALRLPRPSWKSTAAAVTLMFTAAVLGTLLATIAFPWEPMSVQIGASATTRVWFWYSLWINTLVALLGWIIARRLGTRREAVGRLAQMQDRSRSLRQRLAHTQLQAIQARVDPQLLFNILETVKRFYRSDAERAERLLDDLTLFLRAALPRLRSTRSSLEVEFALVGCYVQLMRSAGELRIRIETTLPATLNDAAFPAGLLLPLLARPHGTEAGIDRRVELAARLDADALRVDVSDTAAIAAPTLERLRASVADLYGEQGQVRIVPGAAESGRSSRIELELPREYA